MFIFLFLGLLEKLEIYLVAAQESQRNWNISLYLKVFNALTKKVFQMRQHYCYMNVERNIIYLIILRPIDLINSHRVEFLLLLLLLFLLSFLSISRVARYGKKSVFSLDMHSLTYLSNPSQFSRSLSFMWIM